MAIRFWLACITFGLAACGAHPKADDTSPLNEAWNQYNDPARFGAASLRYDLLPAQGQVPQQHIGWSGDYWPTYKGGIANRWMNGDLGGDYRSYQYPVLTPHQVQGLTAASASRLSPSEKYDLIMGRYDFPLTRAEQGKVDDAVVDGEVPSWYGICHGWAAAALREHEPGAVATAFTPNGLRVDFNHADIEALISETYADLSKVQYKMIGSRCDDTTIQTDPYGRPVSDACRDTNPGSFHLVLAELIGREQRGFLADLNSSYQVWNYPVIGYQSQFRGLRPFDPGSADAPNRAPDTKFLVDVQTVVTAVGGGSSSAQPNGYTLTQATFAYSLELDAGYKIIGGEWIGDKRPDFLWEPVANPVMQPTDVLDYQRVRALLDASIGLSPAPG